MKDRLEMAGQTSDDAWVSDKNEDKDKIRAVSGTNDFDSQGRAVEEICLRRPRVHEMNAENFFGLGASVQNKEQ